MIDPKVLFLTYAFPPVNAPRSVQISRLLKYADLNPDLVCGVGHYQNDANLYPEAVDQLKSVHRVPFTKRQETWAKIKRKQPFGMLKDPDLFYPWVKKAVKETWKIFNHDVLVSFGSPMSVHLGALKIKRKTGVKWIACFSDPWADNPFNNFSPALSRKVLKAEKLVFEQADKLFFNTPETIDLVMKKYNGAYRDKCGILPHSFDPELYPDASPPEEAPLIFRYIGHFYGNRSPEPLLDALLKLPKAQREKIHVECYGGYAPSMIGNPAYKELLGSTVSFHKAVPYQESLALMKTAHALLVIDAPADISVFLPSKLVDYIGSGRPIMGITPPGASDRILKSLGQPTSDTSDVDSIVANLSACIEQLSASQAPASYEQQDYHPKHVGEILSSAINSF